MRRGVLALAEAAEPHLGGPEQSAWLARLETEHDNLRAALTWWYEVGDARHGLRLATALLRFWDTRDHMAEGQPRLMAFLALPGDGVSSEARARALDAASELTTWQGQHAMATQLATEALVIHRDLGAPAGIARSLWLFGTNALAVGDIAQAQTAIDEGIAVARIAGNRVDEGLHLRLSGMLQRSCGEPQRAIPFFDASIALWRALGARDELCNDLGELALTVGHLGEIARARELWAELLPLAYEIGEAWQVAMYLEGQAELFSAGGPARAGGTAAGRGRCVAIQARSARDRLLPVNHAGLCHSAGAAGRRGLRRGAGGRAGALAR